MAWQSDGSGVSWCSPAAVHVHVPPSLLLVTRHPPHLFPHVETEAARDIPVAPRYLPLVSHFRVCSVVYDRTWPPRRTSRGRRPGPHDPRALSPAVSPRSLLTLLTPASNIRSVHGEVWSADSSCCRVHVWRRLLPTADRQFEKEKVMGPDGSFQPRFVSPTVLLLLSPRHSRLLSYAPQTP